MIQIGQRKIEVPLWLWVAVPLALVIHAAYGSTIYGIDTFNPDGFYLSVVRQCAVGSLAGFLLADLARRSTVPWYGLLFLAAASFAASFLAINGLNSAVDESARLVGGLAISIAGSIGAAGPAVLVLMVVSFAVPLLGGLIVALVFTVASRFLIGLPLWAADTRREFWANLGAAMLWLLVAFGGYIAIRFGYGLPGGHPASAVPRWLPLAAASLSALAAAAVQLRLAYRFRRNELKERHGLKIWLLAAACLAAFIYNPGAFGITGFRLMYDHVRPMLRAAHLLPTPEIAITNYRVSVPYHDFKTTKGAPMPDGKPSYVGVILPEEYGLSSVKYTPRVSIYRRDITLQRTSTWWIDRRKVLEDMKAAQPGADAIARFPGPRGAIGLRSDEYPDVDIQLADFDPAASTQTAEQALRRFLRERLQRAG